MAVNVVNFDLSKLLTHGNVNVKGQCQNCYMTFAINNNYIDGCGLCEVHCKFLPLLAIDFIVRGGYHLYTTHEQNGVLQLSQNANFFDGTYAD